MDTTVYSHSSIPITQSDSSDSMVTAVDRDHPISSLKDLYISQSDTTADVGVELFTSPVPAKPDLEAITSRLESLFREHYTSICPDRFRQGSVKRLRIAGIIGSDDAGCMSYSMMISKHCAAVGVDFECLRLDKSTDSPQGLSQADKMREAEGRFTRAKQLVRDVNKMGIDGLIIFTPIFGGEKDEYLRSLISPEIDIEALSPVSKGRYCKAAPVSFESAISATSTFQQRYKGGSKPERKLYPCTPMGVASILMNAPALWNWERESGRSMVGKNVVIVNRSPVFGLPLAIMLANTGATVYSMDHRDTLVFYRPYPTSTVTITSIFNSQGPVRTEVSPISDSEVYQSADVIISAVPSPTFQIPDVPLKAGVGLINVATESNFSQGTISQAAWYIPKVGSVTRWCLLLNALVSKMGREGQTDLMTSVNSQA